MRANQEATAVQNRECFACRDQLSRRFTQVAAVRVDAHPIEPGRVVVLGVCVVVALLGVPELVPGQQHGCAMGEQHRREQIPFLVLAQGRDLGIVGGTLDAAIPRMVIAVTVPILLAIRLVVLVFVRAEFRAPVC